MKFACVVICVAFVIVSIASGEESNPMYVFADWLQTNGVRVSKLGVAPTVETGRGIVATADIEVGDIVVAVPPEVALSGEAAQKVLGKYLEGKQYTELELLALYLMTQRMDPNSPWAPYINVLPRQFNTPLYWRDEELEQLKGSVAYDTTVSRKQRIATFYNDILTPLIKEHPAVFPAEHFSLNEYAWAFSVVLSRSYGMTGSDGRVHNVMVPMLDMFNHDNVPTRFGVSDTNGVFHIAAKIPVPNQKEVKVSFGEKTNADLLTTYGITLADNEHDGVSVRVALDPADPFFDIRARMLQGVGYQSEMIISFTSATPLPAQLLPILRIHYLTPSQFDQYRNAVSGPVSLENELRVLRRLGLLCKSALETYPTSVEEDVALLKSTEITDNVRTAIQVRMSEKVVLRAVVQSVADQWLSFLRNGFEEEEATK